MREIERRDRTVVARAVPAMLGAGDRLLRRRVGRRRPDPGRILREVTELVVVASPDGRVVWATPSAGRLLGPDQVGVADLSLLATTAAGRADLAAHLCRRESEGGVLVVELIDRDGATAWYAVSVHDRTAEPAVAGLVVTLRDVSNETVLRHELERLATTDPLTGLPNRLALDAHLDAAADRLGRGEAEGGVALAIVALDDFRVLNDAIGHAAGDRVLVQVADRLAGAARTDDILVRLGGDQFAVLMARVDRMAPALQVGERLKRSIESPIPTLGRSEQVRASVGVAVATGPAAAGRLLAEAELAMREAKGLGGNRVTPFESRLESEVIADGYISRALRTADHDTEMHLVFQPIVIAASGEVVGYEALLRWHSPVVGPIPPDRFIPLAEHSGEIGAIGAWVLNSACRQLVAWREAGIDPELTVSVNVSPRQLADRDFVAETLATIDRWGLPPRSILIEVTESSVLDGSGMAQRRLAELREAGLGISIDDFGSGYSNLGQLLRVPADVIKIDRSLLVMLSEMRLEAGGDPSDPCAIMEAVVSIARVLGARVVCEGVETEMQRTSLIASGITHVQGYLTGRPVPADEVTIPGTVAIGRPVTGT